jgi:hypothetical protein
VKRIIYLLFFLLIIPVIVYSAGSATGPFARKTTKYYDYITRYVYEMTDNTTNSADSPTIITLSPNNAIISNFSGTVNKYKRFYIMPPPDMDNATIWFHWGGFITSSTSPGDGNQTRFELACACFADDTLLSNSMGTAVDNNATFTANTSQYKRFAPQNLDGSYKWSTAITVKDWVRGNPIECRVGRLVNTYKNYNQNFGLSGVTIRILRTSQ